MRRVEGKTALERSGGYADGLPCEKRSLSKGSSAELTMAVLSRAEICFPQNCERHHITRPTWSKSSKDGTHPCVVQKRIKDGRGILRHRDALIESAKG